MWRMHGNTWKCSKQCGCYEICDAPMWNCGDCHARSIGSDPRTSALGAGQATIDRRLDAHRIYMIYLPFIIDSFFYLTYLSIYSLIYFCSCHTKKQLRALRRHIFLSLEAAIFQWWERFSTQRDGQDSLGASPNGSANPVLPFALPRCFGPAPIRLHSLAQTLLAPYPFSRGTQVSELMSRPLRSCWVKKNLKHSCYMLLWGKNGLRKEKTKEEYHHCLKLPNHLISSEGCTSSTTVGEFRTAWDLVNPVTKLLNMITSHSWSTPKTQVPRTCPARNHLPTKRLKPPETHLFIFKFSLN